jgi:hypothetical protein
MKNDSDRKIEILLLIFNIILTLKSISAGYYAAKYSMQNNLFLINYQIGVLSTTTLILFFSLIPIIVSLFHDNKKVRKICNIIAISLILIGGGYLLLSYYIF